MKSKNLEETLKPFFEYLQKQYTIAEEDYLMSSLFSSGACWVRLKLIEDTVNELNEMYKTNYVIKKEFKFDSGGMLDAN